jgi:Xaa-Pro aminopeptidase
MNRISKLLQVLKEKQVEGFFTSSVANITYLTGFTGDSSRLIITPDRCVLMTDGRYTEQAKQECPEEVEIFKWLNNKRYANETYFHIIDISGIKSLGFEGNLLSYTEYETLNKGLEHVDFINIEGVVESIRQQKDPEEIEKLSIACDISDRALELTLPYIREGITELELTARLEFNMKTNGAENLSFETLVISGTRTSLLHGKPSDKKINRGELVLLDFGALYKGYHADISRTFIMGQANEKQKEIYTYIQQAEMKAIMTLKPGISAQIPDQKVRSIIPDKYLDYYYPGLGHGVGIQIHEEPFLGHTSENILEQNMTLTIEPGIYIPGWGGIRIEDTVVIQEQSARCLSRFPRDLIIL